MTILNQEVLTNFIDLIADGVSVSEASTAIGCSPKSKIIFLWLKNSEEAADFEAPAAESEKWCIVRDCTPQWFHTAYREAVIAGRVARSIRRTPIRAELEAKLRAKRMEPPKQPGYSPPRVMVGKPSDEPANPVTRDLPAPPSTRPSYAYRSKPLDAANTEPPTEGRFVMATQRISNAQRRAGTVEITDEGVKQW